MPVLVFEKLIETPSIAPVEDNQNNDEETGYDAVDHQKLLVHSQHSFVLVKLFVILDIEPIH